MFCFTSGGLHAEREESGCAAVVSTDTRAEKKQTAVPLGPTATAEAA